MTRRRLLLGALLLLGVATAAGAEEVWVFSFSNGDRLRGGIAGIRNGTVLVAARASPRAVAVPIGEISAAEPVPPDADDPAPRPAAQILRLRDGAPLLGRCRAIRQGKIEFEVESIGIVTIHARDVAELLPAEDAVRAYYRAMNPSSLGEPLSPERFDALWTYLARPDANLALQAHRELVRAGEGAMPELAARLRIQPDVIAGWIAALDADSAEVRILAHARLRQLGGAAAPHLKAAAQQPVSAEARRRIAALLADLADDDRPREPDPESIRFLRAIRVLEEIGTEEAQSVLERLANGAPGAPTAREAQAALERLRRVR